MKKILFLSCVIITLVSCRASRHAAAGKPVSDPSVKQGKSSPVFNENNARSPGSTPDNNSKVQTPVPAAPDNSAEHVSEVEKINSLQFKYAILLDAPVEEILDHKLIDFLESWYGTRYLLGGVDRSGVDCSAFVQSFMVTIYGISLPRTSREQYLYCNRISKKDLQEGDLVFFHTQHKKKISHVGVYLRNNKFVHASTTSGVMISDLSEPYFSSHFAGSGRPAVAFGQGSSN